MMKINLISPEQVKKFRVANAWQEIIAWQFSELLLYMPSKFKYPFTVYPKNPFFESLPAKYQELKNRIDKEIDDTGDQCLPT